MGLKEQIQQRKFESITFQQFCEENLIPEADVAKVKNHFQRYGLNIETSYPRVTWTTIALVD